MEIDNKEFGAKFPTSLPTGSILFANSKILFTSKLTPADCNGLPTFANKISERTSLESSIASSSLF